MATTAPPEHLDAKRYPALVQCTEELGRISAAAERQVIGPARKLVVGLCKDLTKRAQSDPDMVQRYADHGLDPMQALRAKLGTHLSARCTPEEHRKAVEQLVTAGWLSGQLIGNVTMYRVSLGERVP